MPQEHKAHPAADPVSASAKETLEGWVPSLASEQELREALDKAFDYRGDVTVTLKSGERIEGYIFDRRSGGGAISACSVRLIPKDRDEKVSIAYGDIARLEFTGRDTAAGKSFETWLRKYNEQKAAKVAAGLGGY
jgi:hypothetical protein